MQGKEKEKTKIEISSPRTESSIHYKESKTITCIPHKSIKLNNRIAKQRQPMNPSSTYSLPSQRDTDQTHGGGWS
jgi:hypothetical protein